MADWNGEYISPYAEHGEKKRTGEEDHGVDSTESSESTDR